MMLSYQYPVAYFYSDDLEDSEVIQKEGCIEPIRIRKEPYEAVVTAEGYSFHILFGSQRNGMFCVFPTGVWAVNCPIWMMSSGITNRLWEGMNPLDTKMLLPSHTR